MSSLKSLYSGLLATLYWDIEALLVEYGDPALLAPSAREAMWAKFEALRQRFAALKDRADEILAEAGPAAEHDSEVRVFLRELERLLDVEREGEDWDCYVGAAMIHAENRICDEANWVEHWA